jgi:hypothetical protein
MIPGLHALGLEMVGELIGSGIHLGKGSGGSLADEIATVGPGIDGPLKKVGQVERTHGRSRTRL